jgi:flagellar basal body-associated protein FliL
MKRSKKLLIVIGILLIAAVLVTAFALHRKPAHTCDTPGYPGACEGTCYDSEYYVKHLDFCKNV